MLWPFLMDIPSVPIAGKKESDVSAGSDVSDRPLVDLYVEVGELSDDHDMTAIAPDQALSA